MIEKRTKTVTLTLKRKELLYDIQNYAFVEADAIRSENEQDRQQVIDVAQEGNIDIVTRNLDIAYAECVEMMYPYTKEECDKEESRDDELKMTDEYVINLLVPDDFSKTTATFVARYVHEYMIYRVLATWLGMVYPASAEGWAIKAEDALQQIKVRLNARCRRVRRTQTPF